MNIPTEYQEQQKVVQYLKMLKNSGKIVDFHSVPNENPLSYFNRQKAIKIQARLKSIGAKAGVPDLFVYLKDKLLVIEMKRKKGGRLTENQKKWLSVFNSLPYSKSFVAYGAEEAIKFLKEEING